MIEVGRIYRWTDTDAGRFFSVGDICKVTRIAGGYIDIYNITQGRETGSWTRATASSYLELHRTGLNPNRLP